jgi:hypothetical protein
MGAMHGKLIQMQLLRSQSAIMTDYVQLSPGRFFVSYELKMLIAYMVMNYDIKPLPVRPPNKWFGRHIVPPMKKAIRVRRKVTA